ncbi:MAG TPA: L,D-transpeptidase family protein [Solirubrobacteraceae bacterium]|nr:L,D-transpeptidase family protein [Solirubrobacteraceae bacterium]
MNARIARLLAAAVALAAGAPLTLAGHGHGFGGVLAARAADSPAPAPLAPTRVVGLPGPTILNGTAPLNVMLSAPVSPATPAPSLSPSVAGSWKLQGDSEIFTPVSTLLPCTRYSLTIWGRTQSSGYAELGRRHTIRLTVACPPLAGLQQALARLGYIGASFRPLYDVHYPPGKETRRAAAEHAFHPPRGRLAPDPADAPPAQLGELDPATRGALEVFQADNGLEAGGQVDRATWLTLLYDVSVDKRDPQPYTWAQVSESLPETLWLHRGGRVVFSTPVNTGVPGAETELGVFPIYARYESTTMAGEDVDGAKYDVPDVPWVNYFNGGDAVHGYPREAYGFPQSNGCVELPIEAAHTIYPMLQIGDIVWVQ